MNQKRATATILLLGLACCGVVVWERQSHDGLVPREDIATEVFGGQQYVELFQATTNVLVQRVHYRGQNKGAGGFLSGFGVTNSYSYDLPIALSAAEVQEFRGLLLKPSSYMWTGFKGCMPEFAVVIHFTGANSSLAIGLCYTCRQIVLFDVSGNTVKRLNIEDDFDPIYTNLATMAKRIYPTDPEILALR